MFLVATVHTVTAAETPKTHDGTVVSAGNGKLEMKTDEGQTHSHAIDSNRADHGARQSREA